ncbi:hypothetical protein FH972_002019 [Carpinus fangiana]|uniref:RING-type domain-containing protein n=1 Tax=Carpinus fangiana TaxID=176857 RepID=A0A5N6QDK1_9ROSI|nr:hypothetical protein FH972_002019 [Carpinus fangiana]
MPFGNRSYFRFRVWDFRRIQPMEDLSLSRPHAPDEVPIQFRTTEYLKIKKIGNGDRQVSVAQARSRTRSKTFWVPKRVALLCDGGARMLSLLSDVGAPAEHQEAVSRDISSAAAARSVGMGTSPILVTLEHTTILIVDDDPSDELMDMGLRESMAEDVARPIPATRSAIEGLKKVTFEFEDGLRSIGECIICTEEFEGGLELTRLPCSHVYHGDCIVKWLETSHRCPLCRYPLPYMREREKVWIFWGLSCEVSSFLEIHDIAGLVRGAQEGQGLGNSFLSDIRAVDGFFHVLRAFEDPDIIHIDNTVDPLRDLEVISAELRLKVKAWLEDGEDVCLGDWKAADIEILNTFQLLTAKPIVYLLVERSQQFSPVVLLRKVWSIFGGRGVQGWWSWSAEGGSVEKFCCGTGNPFMALGRAVLTQMRVLLVRAPPNLVAPWWTCSELPLASMLRHELSGLLQGLQAMHLAIRKLAAYGGAFGCSRFSIFTLELDDKRKLKDCKAFLRSSRLETCKVPIDVNHGISSDLLSSYRIPQDNIRIKIMKLYSTGPFFYTSQPN